MLCSVLSPAQEGNCERVLTRPFHSQAALIYTSENVYAAALLPTPDYLGELLILAYPQLGKMKTSDFKSVNPALPRGPYSEETP